MPKAAIHKRIIFWIVVPVSITAVTISGLLIAYLSPPIDAFLRNQFDANLRLASNMGLRVCESSFNYLLDLRLEDNVEMNRAMKYEAIEEIKALSDQVPKVQMLILNADRTIIAWSLDAPIQQWEIPAVEPKNDAKFTLEINAKTARAHVRFFPFWDWYIISFVFEKDFLSPIRMSHSIIYLSTLGVFVAVFATLLFVFHRFVNKPLQRLIDATQGISKGLFLKVDAIADNELGQLTTAFNSMVASLEGEKAAVRHLINQLSTSESQFRALFESAPLGICVTTYKGNILKTNQSLQEIVGFPGDELETFNFYELFASSGDGHAPIPTAGAERSIDTFETEIKRKDGLNIPVRVILTQIVLNQQQALFAIIENVTIQKILEAQLIQARKLEGVGSLAGGVAHDFNNLLSPIIGYSELLLNDLDTDDQHRKSIESILQAALKARDIVRQLLAFSRKQTLDFKTVDLNSIITDFYSLLRRTVREDITIENVLEQSIPYIKADPGQIEQILMNLAVNAQDAMPNGGRLTIETNLVDLDADYAKEHRSIHPGQYVMIAVSDTGCGMDAKILEHIFDPFFTTKEKGRGTGFGLATVFGIVKQHSGNIWAYSEPGQGSTFKVYFPVAENQGLLQEEVRTASPDETKATETILVVEDDASVLEMTIAILRRQGHHVLSSSKTVDAVQMAAEHHNGPIHLLLTDVVMPEMNGKELYEKILARFPELKVIYMSGYTNNVIAHHGILEQGINFIQKPFSAKSLVSKIRQVLDTP